ncbi:hypothetical protein FGB62_24g022 [Gracilaria domingensis]|nr:hypothetical protein FGB62_24g022 [Gracilaria domingensis]
MAPSCDAEQILAVRAARPFAADARFFARSGGGGARRALGHASRARRPDVRGGARRQITRLRGKRATRWRADLHRALDGRLRRVRARPPLPPRARLASLQSVRGAMCSALFVAPALPSRSARTRQGGRAARGRLCALLPTRSPRFANGMRTATFIPRAASSHPHTSAASSPLPRVNVVTSGIQHDSRPSHHPVSRHLNQATWALLPLVTTAAQPALAEDAPASDLLSLIKSLEGNPLFDRVLGTTVLVLMAYITIGTIILSIDGLIIKQNDARQKVWVRKRVDGDPYPKTRWQGEIDTEFPPKRSTAAATSSTSLNREQRRIEKKLKDKEEKEQKRKEARAAARKKAADDQ